jgi:hypothetical protein
MIAISKFRILSLLFISAVLLTMCEEPEPEPDTTVKTYTPLANDLSETTYPYNNAKRIHFTYTGERVTQASLVNQNVESPYFLVNYLDEEGMKIRSLYYTDDSDHLSDTLVYDGDNLSQIVQTWELESGDGTYTRTVDFSYSEYGQITEAQDDDERVEFLDYKKGNFTRMKYYQPQLLYDTWLSYDDKPTPFSTLGYLGFVLFANNKLLGPGYITNNNFVKSIQDEYGTRVYTQQFKVAYVYDSKNRPTSAVWTRLEPGDFRRDDFYIYNN